MQVWAEQVRRNVEAVVAVGHHLVFLLSRDPYAILTHYSTNAAVADIQTERLQLYGYALTAMAVKAETRLFLDVGPNNHVGPLPVAGRSAAIGTQAKFGDIENLAKAIGREFAAMLFDKPELHGFWLSKKAAAFF